MRNRVDLDFSGIRDLEAFLSFQAAADYCLTCSDDSSEGDYNPTRECFLFKLEEHGDNAPDTAHAPVAMPVVPVAPRPATPVNSGLQQAQLEQLRELEAKLEEERRQTKKLCVALEQEHTERGAGAREAGRIAREQILADGGVENQLALNRACQKITTAAILLRAMPEPSTPEGHNLRKEAQALLEDAVVQQAESSASHIHSVASAKAGGTTRQDHEVSVQTPPVQKDKSPSVCPAVRAKAPTVHDRVQLPLVKERLLDTRDKADDGGARNILNQKKRDGAACGYHPRRGGRFDSKEDTLHQSPRAPTCLAEKSALLRFPHAFDSPPVSPSTRERQILGPGLTTTAWLAS